MEESWSKKSQRKFFGKRMQILPIFVIFGLILFFVVAGFLAKQALAANPPAIITYQGKLLNNGAYPPHP